MSSVDPLSPESRPAGYYPVRWRFSGVTAVARWDPADPASPHSRPMWRVVGVELPYEDEMLQVLGPRVELPEALEPLSEDLYDRAHEIKERISDQISSLLARALAQEDPWVGTEVRELLGEQFRFWE